MSDTIAGFLRAIHDMSTSGFFVLCAILVALIVLFMRSGFKLRRIGTLIANAKIVPIGSANEGFVAVQGTAEAVNGQPFDAPFTGASCVWYRTMVERMEWTESPRGAGGTRWTKQAGTQSYEPFLLRDSSGVCAVVVDGDYVTPTDRSCWFGKSKESKDRQPPKYPGSVRISEIHAKLSASEESHRYLGGKDLPGRSGLDPRSSTHGRDLESPFGTRALRLYFVATGVIAAGGDALFANSLFVNV